MDTKIEETIKKTRPSGLILQELEQEQMCSDMPDFSAGDTVEVMVKVRELDKEKKESDRIQKYDGVVIAKKNRGINSSFTVRKILNGEGVERVFQTHSPNIVSVEVVRRGKVRRAKLYYLRSLTGKAARIAEKIRK